jgi:hypothetical protein
MSILRERAIANLARFLGNARQRQSFVPIAMDNFVVQNPAVFEAGPMPGVPESQLTQDLRDYLLHADTATTGPGQEAGSAKAPQSGA